MSRSPWASAVPHAVAVRAAGLRRWTSLVLGVAVATGVVVGPAVASVTGHKSSSHQLWSPPQTQLSKTASVPGVNAAAVAKAPQTMTMADPGVR